MNAMRSHWFAGNASRRDCIYRARDSLYGRRWTPAHCAAPAVPSPPRRPGVTHPPCPGAAVDVTFADMPGAMMGQGMGPSMMSLWLSPTTVPQGQVSFRVVNRGA